MRCVQFPGARNSPVLPPPLGLRGQRTESIVWTELLGGGNASDGGTWPTQSGPEKQKEGNKYSNLPPSRGWAPHCQNPVRIH